MINRIKSSWLIIVIVLLAAFLRLYRISDYTEFLGDQGRDVVIVREFLKNGDLFFIGPQTSVGNMYLGPFYYYLFVAPGLLLTWFNPVGPSIVVALLGVLTVYLIYKFSLSWFGSFTAYTAALLYAISPVVIKYSNFSWNPNVMPLFSLLFIYFVSKSRYVLASLAFIICLNSHFLALLLLPPAAIIFLLNRPKKLKPVFLAIVIFILSLTPQILFDIKHDGQNIKSITSFFTYRETTVNLKAYKALPLIPELFNQINTRLLASKNINLGYVVSSIFAILLLTDIIRQIRARKYNLPFIYMSIWIFSGVTGLALYKQHIYDHYFAFLFPPIFITFTYLISRNLPRFISLTGITILIVFAFLENPFRWEPPRQIDTTKTIINSIINESNGQPFNFSLLAKMNYDPGYRYFMYENNAPVKLLQDEITEQLFVVCEPFQMNCQPINHPEWSVAAFGWAKIDKEWEISGIKVFKLLHTQGS